MSDSPLSFSRQANESDVAWQHRVRSYIVKNAPKEHRYYVRNGRPGGKGQRWFIPGLFVAIGLFFAIAGYFNGTEIRELNGPNGKQDEFLVEDLVQHYRDTKKQHDPYYLPVVVIRNESIIPLNSKPKDNDYKIGDLVTVRYTQQGKVSASFVDEDGNVSDAPSTVLVVMGVIFAAVGILVGKFYRGAVDGDYIASELIRLK